MGRRSSLMIAAVAAGLVVAASCTAGSDAGAASAPSVPALAPSVPALASSSAGAPTARAADPDDLEVPTSGWRTDFTKASVDYSEFLSGGPGKDGIPAIDEPGYESIADARSPAQRRRSTVQ